jgi:L-amino acid N-acyltransferase YncA
MNDEMTISGATEGDAGAIAEIFAHYVLESSASFETVPPDAAVMAERIATVQRQGYPWLLARDGDGRVVGFAYAHRFGALEGYRYSCETHIYVAPGSLGGGVGTALINALITACEDRGQRQAFALIAGTEPAAVVLHARAGYLPCGTLASAGWKHGQWVDVFIMQRKLDSGNETLPDGHAE